MSDQPARQMSNKDNKPEAEIPEWPAFYAKSSICTIFDIVMVSPNKDAILRRWLRKQQDPKLYEIIKDEHGKMFKKPVLFLMAVTLIKIDEDYTRYTALMKEMLEAQEQERQKAILEGANPAELSVLMDKHSDDLNELESARHDYGNTELDDTGYSYLDAKAGLSERAVEAASKADADGLSMISHAIRKAHAFIKSDNSLDKKVVAAVELVVENNRKTNTKRSIHDLYALFDKDDRDAVQKSVKRLELARFFTPDSRSKLKK